MKRFFERYSIIDVLMALIGASILALVIIGTFSTLFITKRYDSRDWFNFIVYGVALGGIYAVIAIGYTMVYGILRMINFAHSEVFMSGPLTAYFLADAWGRSGFLDQNPVLGLLIIFALAMF